MKILLALKSGLSRMFRAWKGIMIQWFISLAIVSIIVVPLKAGLKAAFGGSMVTEKLVKGVNFDVLGDLGKNLQTLGSSLFSGLILLSLLAILLNIFITGGLFDALRQGTQKVTSENFFGSSAKNFRPFLLITVILYLIIICLLVFVILIPVAIAGNSESAPEGSAFITFTITFPLFLAGSSVICLAADYARAWQVSRAQPMAFKAIGFGFSETFSTFKTSFSLVILIFFIQVLPGWAMMKIIAGYTPSTRGGLILLFIASQLLFLLRLFVKVLRYGSVTSLMDLNQTSGLPVKGNRLQTDLDDFIDLTLKFNPGTNV